MGNTLYEVKTPSHHLLYKGFHSFRNVDISYNPPDVSAMKRKNSVIIQKHVAHTICCTSIEIPKIRFVFKCSFVMDYLDNGVSLKSLLDNGRPIASMECLGKAIAQSHNTTTRVENRDEVNELLYKMKIQYNCDSLEGLTMKNRKLYKELYNELFTLRDIIYGRDIQLLMYYDISLFLKKYKVDWNCLFDRAKRYRLENALYYTLYHCQLIFGNIVPHKIYESRDMEHVKKNSNAIYDRWFTRDTLTPVGKWSSDFMDRLFDENRKYAALLSFYNDYINQVLFSGGYFKVVDIDSEERFS